MTELIVLDEAMTLPMLAPLQMRLLALATEKKAVTLDLSRLVQLDLGFIQLVSAARDYAKRKGTSFTLSAPAPAPVEVVLRRAGFLADAASDETAFWRHGA